MHKRFVLASFAALAVCLQCGLASSARSTTSVQTVTQDSRFEESYQSATVAPAKLEAFAFEDPSVDEVLPNGVLSKPTDLTKPKPHGGLAKPMPHGGLAKPTPHGALAKPTPHGALAKPLPQAAVRPNRPSAQLRRHVAA